MPIEYVEDRVPHQLVLDDETKLRHRKFGCIEAQRSATRRRHRLVPDPHPVVGANSGRLHMGPRADSVEQSSRPRRNRRNTQSNVIILVMNRAWRRIDQDQAQAPRLRALRE